MKKMLLAVAVTTTLLLFVGCKNAASGDPKTVLMAFFEAISKKDFTAAKKLATKDSETMFSMMEMGMNAAKGENKDMDKFDKTKVDFGDAVIDGDKATVAIKEKGNGETTNMILKKEDGNWKVAFDKASLMQMATDKMKEHGMNSNDVIDSVGNAMDKLKNMDTDSLANQMKQSMDKLKELQQNPEAAKKMQDAMEKLKEAADKMKQH